VFVVSALGAAGAAGVVSAGGAVGVGPVPVGPAYVLLEMLAPQERYRERQVLDPQSDEWMEEPVVEESGPGGELNRARGLLAEGQVDEARRQLKQWVRRYPDHERYAEAEFLLGETYFEKKDYYTAYEHYEIAADNSSGELFYKALRRAMDVARAFMAGQKRLIWKFLPLPAYDDGVEILGRVWERVPGTRMGEEALKLKADFRFERGEMELAQDEYANLAREYPSGRYVQMATLRSAEAAEAAFPGVHFDDRPLLNAEERYRQVRSTFPHYAERESVDARLAAIRQKRAEKDLEVARWYERTGQKGAAEFYYRLILREWPETLAESVARSRLRALGIELESPREGGS
jgi:outer membrane protein assembly factor BamD (BamD/ComL family)